MNMLATNGAKGDPMVTLFTCTTIHKLLIPAILLMLGITTSSASVVKTPGDTFELLILHNNDMHARFEQTSQLGGICTTADREAGKCYGGFPRVAHVVKEARKAAQSGEGPPVLYLIAGDTYTGSAWFTIYKWKIAAEFVNALQPDAVSLGNHEFDNGVSGLTPFIENLTCPVLCANLVLNKVPELAKEPNLKKSIVLDVAGHKIGVVGYLTPDTKVLAVPNDVEYSDEIEALSKEVKKLQSAGIKIIIAVGHSGYLRDLQIAEGVDGLDLVIGGHTNTFLWNGTNPDAEQSEGFYPTYMQQPSGRKVPVVQAYAYTKYLGKIHLLFDSEGNIVSSDGMPILLNHNIPQDEDILKITNKYKRSIDDITEEVIGSTAVVLDAQPCSRAECNIGNLITDAMVYKYASEYTGVHWTYAPIAIIQAGGIRTSIACPKIPTNITSGDILAVMPFDGSAVTVTANGSILYKMMEHSVAGFNILDSNEEFLQYSGIKVVYDLKRPARSRVVSAKVRCWACNIPKYTKITEKDIYKVIMPSFVANGGDGFSMFIGLPTTTLGYNELLSTEYYISRHSPIYAHIEGRITLLHETECNSSSTAKVSLLLIFYAILTSIL